MNSKTIARLLIIIALGVVIISCSSSNSINTSSLSDKAVKLSPKQQEEKESLIEQAKKEGILGDLEAARKSYLKALKIDPQCDACYYEMAMLYYRASYAINALNFSRAAYKIDSTNIWYQRQLAQLSAITGNYKDAENLYTKLLERNPENPDLYLSLASTYENQRKFDKAIVLYDSVQNRFGTNENVIIRKQEIYSAQRDYTNSIAEAEKLVNIDPDDPRFYTILGDSYAQAMQDSMALKSYNDALTVEPSFPPAILGRAEIFRKNGNFDEYFRNLQLYFNSDLIDDLNKVEYLSLVLRIPSFSEYFKPNIDSLFTILNTKHPKSNDIKYLQAGFFMQVGQPDSAINLLTNVIKSDSTNYNNWGQLLSMEYSLMRWDDLNKNAGKAIAIFPDRPYFYMYRGIALWQKDELEEAAKDFEHSLKLSKDDERFTNQVHAFLGDLYHQMGKDSKAFENYEKVLKTDSTNATVLNNYAYFMAIKGKNLDKAYKLSKKAIEIESNNVSFLDTFGWILYLQGKYTEARVILRQALAAGGKDSAVILDHYADVLYALGEYDTASVYWSQALEKPDVENRKEIEQKIQKLSKK